MLDTLAVRDIMTPRSPRRDGSHRGRFPLTGGTTQAGGEAA